jgi:hypothetical protein
LTIKDRLSKSIIEEALDYGATFKTPRDATRYVRAQIMEMVIVLLGLLMVFVFGGLYALALVVF